MTTDLILAALFVCASPSITDGDTIRCDQGRGERVRIFGVQAPERTDPAGPAATRAMRQIINGKDLACEVRGPPSWGRKVALCRLPDGRDVANELVCAGVAVDWFSYSRGRYAVCVR